MTTLGRQRPAFPVRLSSALSFARRCAGWAFVWQASRALAATTELIVVDRNSGLAIYGFDPVAYFTDSEAKTGERGPRVQLWRCGLAVQQ